MNKLSATVMYGMWILAVILLLATTFTNFVHTDLNILAGVFLFFAFVNSFFMMTRR